MSDWLSIATRQDFGRNGGTWTRTPSIICLHSTEGGSWPDYNGGADAPHFTIDPRTGQVRQHTPLSVAGRALMHPAGTPETNRAGVVQVEIIGTCDGATASRYNIQYLPEMSDADAANVRALLDAIHAATGIPLTSSVSFKQYPGSYGGGNGVRLSRAAFAGHSGVIGHQHVPDNDHGDPGDIPLAKILSAHTDGPAQPGPAVKPPTPAPTPHPVVSGKLTVDGLPGPATYKALQRWAGVPADGVLGPNTRAAVQRKVGVPADGVWGPQTWRAIQRLVGSAADGVPGPNTWRAVQSYLNKIGA